MKIVSNSILAKYNIELKSKKEWPKLDPDDGR